MANGKFVAYYRVSTARQGSSGLGLAAQRQAVEAYLNGGRWSIVAEFTEVESGRKADRPALEQALAAAQLHRVPLVVAKVDRLTRSLAFLSKLLEAGVEVRFCDLPQIEGATGRFMLQQMASVAELEAGLISDRTKKALAASKKPLGGFRGPRHYIPTQADAMASAKARKVASDKRAASLAPTIKDLQANGVTSLRSLAAALSDREIPAPRGGSSWSPSQVSRVLASIASVDV